MVDAVLREVRLTAFKSFGSAVLPVGPLTVLTGRNSSGKSNALDGIEVLARLAGGEEIIDALDGRHREGGAVRGGSRGCAPHGARSFKLGCTVSAGTHEFEFDVEIQITPDLRVVYERLAGPAPALSSGVTQQRVLMETSPPTPGSTSIEASVYNGKKGRNPILPFRDSRLVVTQLPSRILPHNKADRSVVAAAEAVAAALRATFHLDPIPHLMREYVPARDTELRRTGSNISAAIKNLKESDPATFNRLVALVRDVSDSPVEDLTVTESDFGDVMLAIREGPRSSDVTPAREMSDGLLRFLAVATALLTANRGLDIDPGIRASQDDVAAGVLLVVEELENGLHPAQAARVLRLIQETSNELGTQVIFTTHSPALLNALPGEALGDVVVAFRGDAEFRTRLRRLTDLPGYPESMASGRLGDLVSRGELVKPDEQRNDYAEFNRILGLE